MSFFIHLQNVSFFIHLQKFFPILLIAFFVNFISLVLNFISPFQITDWSFAPILCDILLFHLFKAMDRFLDPIYSINKTKESWLIVGRVIRLWNVMKSGSSNIFHTIEVIFMDRQVVSFVFT